MEYLEVSKIFIPALVFGLRLFQGGCVVHAVSRHGHNVADAVVAVFLVGLSAGFWAEKPGDNRWGGTKDANKWSREQKTDIFGFA